MSRFHRQMSVLFQEYLSKNAVGKGLFKPVVEISNTNPLRSAAVLCCLKQDRHQEISVLINMRSSELSRSPGDACFPGGMTEEGDISLEETALREAEEEIGLKRKDVKILCTLPSSIMGYKEIIMCNTVVCTLETDDISLQPNNEVDHVFWVPLRLFLEGNDNHWQVKTTYKRKFPVWIDYFRIPNEQSEFIVWGLTARLCTIAASIVYSRAPSFPFRHYYITSTSDSHVTIGEYQLPSLKE